MTTIRRPGFKHWEIWLYYMHDYHDKVPAITGWPFWEAIPDLALPLRLVKPGRAIDNLNVFPEKLFVTARMAVDTPGGVGYLGYFVNGEGVPRLTIETESVMDYDNLNGTIDISDIFPMTDNVQVSELEVAYCAGGAPGTAVHLACHQVHYCVRR